jgi:hypothetical protein
MARVGWFTGVSRAEKEAAWSRMVGTAEKVWLGTPSGSRGKRRCG